MRLHKLTDAPAFVAIDLDDAEVSSGPVRWAKKVLQRGAKDLARSQTYTYAALGMRRGGASAGISAPADEREAAIAAFVAEIRPLVEAGTYLPDPAKGVTAADLAPLADADPRPTARLAGPEPRFVDRCEAVSIAAAADAAVGLDQRGVAIEGVDARTPALVAAVAERGGRVVALATPTATVGRPDGFDPDAVTEAFAAHGPQGGCEALGDPSDADAVWAGDADIVVAGSRMGIVDHERAAGLDVAALVPGGRLPVTARALAVLSRAGAVVVPDFLSLAGSTIAAWAEPDLDDDVVTASVADEVAERVREAVAHERGAFLGACYAAEAFLSSWRDELPFGRPLAP